MYVLMGLGVSNKAVVEFLNHKLKEYVIVLNDEEKKKYQGEYNNVIGYQLIKMLDISKIKAVIKSPGIPHHDEYIKYFKNKHVLVINEIEFAYMMSKKRGKYIGVSGSVGKSSAVSLLYNLIKAKHSNVILSICV